MFGMFEKLTKATVAIVLTPVAVVVDVVSLPATIITDSSHLTDIFYRHPSTIASNFPM